MSCRTNDFEKALHERMATDMDTVAVGLKIMIHDSSGDSDPE
jgi:hypothetical protein